MESSYNNVFFEYKIPVSSGLRTGKQKNENDYFKYSD
jgi:hypothetical protein